MTSTMTTSIYIPFNKPANPVCRVLPIRSDEGKVIGVEVKSEP